MQLTPIGAPETPANLVIHALPLHSAAIGAMAVLDDQVTVVSGSADAVLLRWSLETGEVMERLEGHTGPINAMAVHGQWLATASDDRTVRLWGVGDRLTQHQLLDDHEQPVRGVAMSERHLVTVSEDAVVRVFEVGTTRRQDASPPHMLGLAHLPRSAMTSAAVVTNRL